MTIRAVLFDLMDTVLRDPYREAIRAATGLEVPIAMRFRDPHAWPEFEVAAIDEAEWVRRFFAAGGPLPAGSGAAVLRFDLEAFHAARRAGYEFLPGMRELVASLAGRVERHVASNYPVWIEELRLSHGLDELFEGVWASHHLRVRKPAPEFFERLLARIGKAPEECLFVDDRAQNCEAAAAFGLRAHVFVSAAGLREALSEQLQGQPID